MSESKNSDIQSGNGFLVAGILAALGADRIPKSVDTRYAYPDTCIRETSENFGIVERDFGSPGGDKVIFLQAKVGSLRR